MNILYPEYLILIIPIILYLYQNKFRLKIYTHIIILILLLISLSRPVIDNYIQDSDIKGRDIVIALDISQSMQADDIKPNRYKFAKNCIKKLLEKNPNDNVMLVVFTTNPLLLSPPTTDHQLILTALDSLNLEYILTKGTSLKKLFLKLKSMKLKDKNLLLITDGGEENDVKELTNIIKNQTKSLTILALGDISGSVIKNQDNSLQKDKNGNLVVSRINPLLKELSEILEANYIMASSSVSSTVDKIDNVLKKGDEIFTKKEHKYLELYPVALFIATVLFFLLHTKWAKFIIILFTFLSINIEASNYKDTTFESEIIKANNYYKEHKYKKALKIYLNIKSTSKDIKQALYYNIGNCFAQLRNYTDAQVFYVKSLQLKEDSDTLFNLKQIIFLKDKKNNNGKTLQSSKQNSSNKGDFKEDKNTKNKTGKNKTQDAKQVYKISSKTYELINEGYIYENKPW